MPSRRPAGPAPLRLSTHPPTPHTSVAGPAAWLSLPGLVLAAAAAILAARLT